MNESRSVKKAWDLVEEAMKQIQNLSAEDLQAELDDSGNAVTVVDIRDNRELFLKGKIPGAISAPRGMLEFWVDPASEYHREAFEPSKRYVLYCAMGGRSALAAKTMQDMGYTDVAHLEPGFDGWEAAGFDIEDTKESSKWIPRPED